MSIDDERCFIQFLGSASFGDWFIKSSQRCQKIFILLMRRSVIVIKVDGLLEFFFRFRPIPIAAKSCVCEQHWTHAVPPKSLYNLLAGRSMMLPANCNSGDSRVS